MLLRRLKQRIGATERGQLRCIATSATGRREGLPRCRGVRGATIRRTFCVGRPRESASRRPRNREGHTWRRRPRSGVALRSRLDHWVADREGRESSVIASFEESDARASQPSLLLSPSHGSGRSRSHEHPFKNHDLIPDRFRYSAGSPTAAILAMSRSPPTASLIRRASS